MNMKLDVWTIDVFKVNYGTFYQWTNRAPLDKGRVPERFWPLIPYAEVWGVADDSDRERLIRNAPNHIRENLKEVVMAFDNVLDEWLAGPEADDPTPSNEYIAFSAMRMAAYLI